MASEDGTRLASNTVEGIAQPFLKRIENLMGDMASEKGSYMAKCKEIREDINHVLQEAEDKGVPKKALRKLVKYRELERKQKELSENLDIDEKSKFETLVAALGDFVDTPLGQATVQAAA